MKASLLKTDFRHSVVVEEMGRIVETTDKRLGVPLPNRTWPTLLSRSIIGYIQLHGPLERLG